MTKVYDTATDLITFARSSSGTALRRVGYGENLVDNGDFASGLTSWEQDDTAFSVVGDELVYDASGSGARFGQAVNFTAGKVYQLTFDAAISSTFRVQLVNQISNDNGAQIILDSVSTGANTVVFVANSSSTYLVFRRLTLINNSTLDNISVREVIFDRATDDLVLFNHPDDIPRIEYGSDGSLKGLLIEEQRTNLITNSTPQSGDLATSGGSFSYVTCNFTPLSGPGIHFDTTGVTSYVYFRPTHTVDDYTFSVFVEMNDGNAPTFGSSISPDASNDFAFVIDGGPVNPASYIVEHYGGSTYRVSGTRPSVNTTVRNAGLIKYSGNSSRTFKVTGFQFEQGSFPTSYIPTSGSQKTRDPDIASIPVSAFGYNQEAGTVVAEYMLYNTAFSATRTLAQLDDGTTSNRLVSQVSTGGKSRLYMAAAGSLQDSFGAEDVLEGVANKTAVSFVENSNGISTNGSVTENGDGTSVVPSVTTLRLGLHSNGNFPLNGHLKSIQYYPRRLTDAQLQELTA